MLILINTFLKFVYFSTNRFLNENIKLDESSSKNPIRIFVNKRASEKMLRNRLLINYAIISTRSNHSKPSAPSSSTIRRGGRELDEDPTPVRYSQDVPSFRQLKESYQKKIDEDKKNLNWRIKPIELPGTHKSKLSVFDSEEHVPSSLSVIAQPLDFSIKGIKNWWREYKVTKERFLQQFIPERHQILGNDLATAHFLLFRGGKVKFVGQHDFIEVKEEDQQKIHEIIPSKYDPSYELEAIKCDNIELYYEGLENIRRLKKLKYLSFKNVKLFDDWGMDRMSGSEFRSLEVLDIRGTSVTSNGLQALYRIPTLKKLITDSKPEDNFEWHLTVSMLNDILPNLLVTTREDGE